MGLRFRKSVKIAPGVRLNIGKKSVGISAGVKGYRKSINSSGRVTTSIGVPGTGVSYVKTENLKSKKKKAVSSRVSSTATAASSSASSPAAAPAPAKVQKAAAQPKEKPPKTTAVLQERPDASFVVFGVVALAGAVFLFASSHVIFSVVAALFGIFCLYSFIHIKRHPEDPTIHHGRTADTLGAAGTLRRKDRFPAAKSVRSCSGGFKEACCVAL